MGAQVGSYFFGPPALCEQRVMGLSLFCGSTIGPVGSVKTGHVDGCKCASSIKIRDYIKDQYSFQCPCSNVYFLIFIFCILLIYSLYFFLVSPIGIATASFYFSSRRTTAFGNRGKRSKNHFFPGINIIT